MARFDLASPSRESRSTRPPHPAIIAAAERLHAKGLLTQVDGGYLTSLGRDAAENAHAALTILDSLPMTALQ
ncbi:TIGR02647 family protein [Candidatus Accumulibacter necessarius]|uniref:TIGR02647 family protein n=1 Tax=Candidatus Accumulibacter necessarius TaxID=2954386 RepID=UPI003DA87E50